MHHLLEAEHINQYIKRRQSKDKDSSANKAEYRSRRNKTAKHQAPTISSIDKSLSFFLQELTI